MFFLYFSFCHYSRLNDFIFSSSQFLLCSWLFCFPFKKSMCFFCVCFHRFLFNLIFSSCSSNFYTFLICSFSRFCAMRMEIGMLLHKVIWGIRIFLKPFRLFLHAFLYFEDSCWFILVLKLVSGLCRMNYKI